jgi:RNA polymerase sigma-70 factor (ECF subfamily)
MDALVEELHWIAQAVIEPSAFAAIYDHYFPKIYNYARYRVQDAQTADDLTAQIFERALRELSSYQPERAPFGAWLFGIARHAIEDHYRAQKRRRWLSLDLLSGHASSDPPPEEIAAERETHDRLLQALAELTDRERDVIALKFAAGLTNRQIAGVTSLGESHVGVILHRAARRLKQLLEE